MLSARSAALRFVDSTTVRCGGIEGRSTIFPGSIVRSLCHSQRVTVEEINGPAAISRDAAEIGEKLRELPGAIRDHTKVAHRHITAFYDKASSLLEAIPALQRQLDGVDQLARFGELEKSKGLYALRALQTLERAENKPEVRALEASQ